MDKKSYLMGLVDYSPNFLLPQTSIKDPGLIINGKPYSLILKECQEFISLIESFGISTNIYDATYMLSLMSNTPVKHFFKMMRDNLNYGRGKEPQKNGRFFK